MANQHQKPCGKTRKFVLNLDAVEPVCWDRAREAYNRRDGRDFALCGYSSGSMIDLLRDNVEALLNRDMYEGTLAQAFVGCKINNGRYSVKELEHLLQRADRKRLIAAGQPLPSRGPFTVYRGVSGRGRCRRVRGFSWSLSLDVACSFAARGPEIDQAVYQTKITESEVFFFWSERWEDELVCRPLRCKRLVIEVAEIRHRAEAITIAQRRRNQERLTNWRPRSN
jgi:hypothetical protein